ncbi:heparan-alpha-glucosaminide N-acetyltransferase domain-containing protein [Kocuria sp. M1R5S2]|uniref:heparan-alpha-glucosaminide N-acetyltransferase domain-containing protein n=1 Tax=Kocuria rhizosphaerae TaxID=3376285 RepID=UPI00379A9E34
MTEDRHHSARGMPWAGTAPRTSGAGAGSTSATSSSAVTAAAPPAAPVKRRLVGIDAARGLALIGMISIHILPAWNAATFQPTLQWTVFAGRSAALFALLAGVGLAFSTGARTPHTGRAMTADRWGVAVRALLIASLGLAINQALPGRSIEDVPAVNILVYYGAFFLLAIPFLGLSARALLLCAGCFALAGPALMHLLRDVLPVVENYNLAFADLLTDPGGSAARLLLTGVFPALPYLAYLLAGLAIGRLDLSRLRTQIGLLVGGVLLAAAAWATSRLLLGPAGGLAELVRSTPGLDRELVADVLRFGPDPTLPTTTWWWLAVAGPYTNTPPALLLGLGSAAAVLGLCLLLARRTSGWLLPLSAMGSMTLTVYSAHLLALSTELHYDEPMWFVVHVGVAMVLALVWHRVMGQGPLERAVAAAVRAVRRKVLAGGRTG